MAISKDLNNLVINKIENKEVYNYMVNNNLINDDELYLVQGAEDENIVVDDSLSSTSENPVQNKVIKSKFDSIESNYETKTDAQSKLNAAKTYTDEKIASIPDPDLTNIELITIEDIDTICNSSIVAANLYNEVTF